MKTDNPTELKAEVTTNNEVTYQKKPQTTEQRKQDQSKYRISIFGE